jgi:hypothetical protein
MPLVPADPLLVELRAVVDSAGVAQWACSSELSATYGVGNAAPFVLAHSLSIGPAPYRRQSSPVDWYSAD